MIPGIVANQTLKFIFGYKLLAVAHSTSPYITVYNTNNWNLNPASQWVTVTGIPAPAGNGRAVAFKPDNTLMVVRHATVPCLSIYKTSD